MPFTSRGALIKYSAINNLETAVMQVYGWNNEDTAIRVESGDTYPDGTCKFYGATLASVEQKTTFITPQRFTGLKPKELTIADYGRVLSFEGTSDDPAMTEIKSRKVIFDLTSKLSFNEVDTGIVYGQSGSSANDPSEPLTLDDPKYIYGIEGSFFDGDFTAGDIY